MGFHVGQRVVCVDDSPSIEGLPSLVRKGAIYTIDDVFMTWTGVGVRLAEVMPVPPKEGWHAERFRPVTERATDISVFTEVLTRAPNALEPVE